MVQSAAQLANLRPAWRKGEGGNEQGQNRAYQSMLRFARIKSMDMLKVAIACAEDPEAPWPARVNAALSVIDRAWGKPKEHIQFDADGIAMLRIEFVAPDDNATTIEVSRPCPPNASAAIEAVLAETDEQNQRFNGAEAGPSDERLPDSEE